MTPNEKMDQIESSLQGSGLSAIVILGDEDKAVCFFDGKPEKLHQDLSAVLADKPAAFHLFADAVFGAMAAVVAEAMDFFKEKGRMLDMNELQPGEEETDEPSP